MSMLTVFDTWLDERRQLLARHGVRIHVSRTPGDREKDSAHISLEKGDKFGELIVWTSGEVDCGRGVIGGESSDEHFEIDDPLDLIPLLDSVFEAVVGSSRANDAHP